MILGRLGGARRLPGAAWGQTDTTEYPRLTPWVPWDGSWEAKTIKEPWKNKDFKKSQHKQFLFLNMRTCSKLSCGAGKTAFFFISVIKTVRPNRFWKHPKLSSRAGESAFCNICIAKKGQQMQVRDCCFQGMSRAKTMFLKASGQRVPPLLERV